MAAPDKVFKQVYAWYQQSIDRLLAASGLPAAEQGQARQLLWQLLGVLNAGAPPANPDLADFRDNGAAAESMAVACNVVGEVLAALGHLKQAIAALDGGGNPAAALAVVGPVLEQVDRLVALQPNARYPSAFSIGKMLLMLSGDAESANPPAGHEADQLAALLGAGNAADTARLQAALGIVTLLVGSMLDRSFTAPSNAAAGFVQQALPSFAGLPTLSLNGPAGLTGTLAFNAGPPSALKATLALAHSRTQAVGGGLQLSLAFSAKGGVDMVLPVLPPGPVQVNDAGYFVGLEIKRSGNALTIGSDAGSIKLQASELGVVLGLANGKPGLQFFARGTQATLKPDDGFLQMILGDGISVGMDIVAQADVAGQLRLVGGTGLHASLPVPTLPTGPFDLQLIHLGLEPVDGKFTKLAVEISASFGVGLGPFAASVDRLGLLLKLDLGGGTPLAFAFKPPNGIGLVLDAGIVKGGGYLGVDENGYAGVLELKLLAVDVKAIALLNTKGEVGFSLLLLIFGQFPPIQLSFGFTLTGIGGLIGVQHTASPPALSQALSQGQIDAVLFPANPVANAPQLINTLRTLFPVKAGGFVIGPMLELGWGTPSLVTVRLGLLVEATQFTLLGQAIVALPPLVSADIALLYLRLDFVGSIVFDPLSISVDAKLINSRVGFVSITGQFAFRAAFGSNPCFLISAGGFHPRFKDLPANVPSPFDRVGASLDIGIVGISLKGYFAITSATVQAGAELRAWADIGIAGIEGGIGFDAICYLQPKFYFELDIHAYLAVHVFGIDFASVHLDGLLAGPGRWRIAGNAKVHTPWPLPDFSLSIDESFGDDLDTPKVTVDIAAELALEIAKPANWAAQLPASGDGLVTLASLAAGTDVLAHPLGTLTWQQKRVPLELKLDAASGSAIAGANEFYGGALQLTQGVAPADIGAAQPKEDHFATAQFITMSQDDRLAKPSFESLTAGYVLGSDAFEPGPPLSYVLDHEEADLGVPPASRLISKGLYAESVHGATLAFGAAGQSPLRDRALARPAEATAFKVNPPPLAVADKSTLALAASSAGVYRSVWRATQAAQGRARAQVVEVVEMAS
jgi:hypothetical protein